MAIYRPVQMSFWTDTKVEDDFTPEDKYFYLYLLTNPHTNLIGCYEISLKQISNETGYSKDSIERLLNRFDEVHGVIRYSKSTKEVLLLNWYKHNWTKSSKLDKPLMKEISGVKNAKFQNELLELFNCRGSVEVVEENPKIVEDNDNDRIKEIVEYLNFVCGTNYRHNTGKTRTCIKARLKEGFEVDDFKLVIDKKNKEWSEDSKMQRYLRPETLFGSKFEGYLNQRIDSGSIMDRLANV